MSEFDFGQSRAGVFEKALKMIKNITGTPVFFPSGYSLDINPSAILNTHDRGLLPIDAVLHKPDNNQGNAHKSAYYDLYDSSHDIEGGLATGALAFILSSLACWLIWLAHGRSTLYRQIALYTVGLILALSAPPTAILVTHRLFFGNWGFLF